MNANQDTQVPKLMLKSTKDALLIIEAAERGLFPRLVRRLTEQERAQSIYSGAVFVYDEFESHIRRFTDTLVWSPSRIIGNYLVYREMRRHEPRPTSRAGAALPLQPAAARSLARPRPDMGLVQDEKDRKRREQLYVGSLTHNSKFKPDGLVKRTFSVMTEGKHIHVIGYYTYDDAMDESFVTPSEHPEFADLSISQDLLRDKALYRVPPRIEQLSNGQLVYAGEDSEKSASPRSESASLDVDRDSPSTSSSTRGTPGFPTLPSLPMLPPIQTQPQEDSMYELPPLRPLPPSRTWDDAPTNFDGPPYSSHPRPGPMLFTFTDFNNSSVTPLSASLPAIVLPSLSPPPSRAAPRMRDARQSPYPDNQGRPRAHNLNVARSLREPEYTPTDPSFAPAGAPAFTSLGPPPSYHEQWPTPQMSLDRNGFGTMRTGQLDDGGHEQPRAGILAPVPMRPPPQVYDYEVGPSGETIEYDAPAGRYPRAGDTRMLPYPNEVDQ